VPGSGWAGGKILPLLPAPVVAHDPGASRKQALAGRLIPVRLPIIVSVNTAEKPRSLEPVFDPRVKIEAGWSEDDYRFH
jgi:hypothetical protein